MNYLLLKFKINIKSNVASQQREDVLRYFIFRRRDFLPILHDTNKKGNNLFSTLY